MGQYYKIVNADQRQFMHPHHMGAGLKAIEIVTSWSVPAALVGLIAVDPNNQPADLANNKDTGRWAGDRILLIGDYAENTDLPGWDGPPLSELYGLCDNSEEPTLEGLMKIYEPDTARSIYPKELERWRERSAAGAYTEVTPLGLVEQGASVRFNVKDEGWRTFIPVCALATRTGDDRCVFEPVEKDNPEMMAYYKRCGITEEVWGRAPLDGSWHAITDGEEGLGQTRVLANLDRREFIDPAAFGETPTTAGIMRGGSWGSASALAMLLIYNQRRGGGDLRPNPLVGTWQGHHLIASSERSGRFPSTDEIKASFTNISDAAFQMLAKERD